MAKRKRGLRGTKIKRQTIRRAGREPYKCMITDYADMGDIKECARECGSHWFEKDTMRFFKSRVGDRAYADGRGGAYFVSSEKGPHGPRKYTIRKYDPKKCSIETIGKFQQYRTGAVANRIAKNIAAKAKRSRKK
jgi:hypothetical protein